jgi:cytidine deaminase
MSVEKWPGLSASTPSGRHGIERMVGERSEPSLVEARMSQTAATTLEALAAEYARRSYAPYSRNSAACIALLSDGTCVPGVRVENASFPLLISAMMNAVTTSVAEGRDDFVAFVSSRPITHVERDLLEPFMPAVAVDGNRASVQSSLPEVGPILDAIHAFTFVDDRDGIAIARQVATSARVPESDFQVGCVLGSQESGFVKGVNVEHPDWNLGLCAERNAIGTAVTYGLDAATTMYLTCLKDPTGTPCGACRQVLVEFGESLNLVMDRADKTPDRTTPASLLPDSFDGNALTR